MKELRDYIYEYLDEENFQKYLVNNKSYEIENKKIKIEEEKIYRELIKNMSEAKAISMLETLSSRYYAIMSLESKSEFQYAFLNGLYLGVSTKNNIDINFIREVDRLLNEIFLDKGYTNNG